MKTKSTQNDKMKFHLTVNEEQLRLIQSALDLYSRVLIGQFEEVGIIANMYSVNMLDSSNPNMPKPDKSSYKEHHAFTDMIRQAKTSLGFHANGSYGIYSDVVHNDSRNAYDIVQVIRNYIANRNHVEGESRMFISFDEPNKTGEYDMPVIQEAPEMMI